jgi:antitoxin component YwqK of YwqJK toxin-antitoxin module
MRIIAIIIFLFFNTIELSAKKNISDGEQIIYRKNGTIKEKAFYKFGKLDGIHYEYYEDGKTLKKLTKYKAGKKTGIQRFYDRIGILKDFKEF